MSIILIDSGLGMLQTVQGLLHGAQGSVQRPQRYALHHQATTLQRAVHPKRPFLWAVTMWRRNHSCKQPNTITHTATHTPMSPKR